MQRLIKIFSENVIYAKQSTLFKSVFYLYLLLRALFWFNQYDLFFGEHAVIYSPFRYTDSFKDIAFLLLNSHSYTLAYYFLGAMVLLSIAGLISKKTRPLTDFLLWLVVINLHYKLYASLTGGDYLVNQLLFFNIFLGPWTFLRHLQSNYITTIFHNAAVLAIIVQVCLLYFLSGLAKIIDAQWQSGEALEIIAGVAQFKLIETPHAGVLASLWLKAVNYLVMTYQILFPVVVFIRPIKKPVLLFGLVMHLYIFLFMGLFWFASIMILTYIFFWPTTKNQE